MAYEVSKIYSMVYDDPNKYGYGEYLGEFQRIKQLVEDAWVDNFIGINTQTNELCLILSTEVKGCGGGIAYKVFPLNEYKHDIHGYTSIAEWVIAVYDFEDGMGNRELPHCSNCNRGVYSHDAGIWCPFCGCLMKNPKRM